MSSVDAENSNKKHSPSPAKDNGAKAQPQNGATNTTTKKGDKETINETTKNGHSQSSSKSLSNPAAGNKSMNVLRERSFIRPTNPQMMHPINAAIFMPDPMHHQKRRSFGQVVNYHLGPAHHHQMQQQQLPHHHPQMHLVHGDGGRNKLSAHAQEFTMAMSPYPQENVLQLSKSGGNLHYAMNRNVIHPFAQHSRPQKGDKKHVPGAHLPHSQMPLVTSPSMGNVLQPSGPRVKFAPEPQILHHNPQQPISKPGKQKNVPVPQLPDQIPLQRSKSLSSADTIARGLAGLGFALSADVKDIGSFPPEHQHLIDIAIQDPNQLNARELMDLADVALRRAVEARRYALPLSQLCITIVAKERKETFLEALLNTCRQWYQERDKILGPAINSRNPTRPRFTAFMAFLTEMFCQLKRRQLQLRTQCDGVPPPMVLLQVLLKCCEDCVRPSVRSLSEIECLFYVLTCIGRDLETHLSDQLDGLLASVRDAFLNSNASAPAIRRTLLQLIELQASQWQLPGNTVLYYYPSK